MACRTQRISHFAFSLKAIGANWAASPRAINVKGSTSNSLISECRSGAFDVTWMSVWGDVTLHSSQIEATIQKRWRYGRVKLFSMSIKFVVNWDVAAVPAVMLHFYWNRLYFCNLAEKKKNHGNKKWIFLDLNSTHIVWTDRPSAARLISFYTFFLVCLLTDLHKERLSVSFPPQQWRLIIFHWIYFIVPGWNWFFFFFLCICSTWTLQLCLAN